MTTFNFPHSAKVDSDRNSGEVYVLWSDQVSIQTVALTPQEVYLSIKVHNLTNSFILIAIYSCPYDSFKKLL